MAATPSYRYSANRLAYIYVALCALFVGAVLWLDYLITARALEREIDIVIATELEALKEDYDVGGLNRLVEALNRRTDSWGRTGAVYLLVDTHDTPVAGNLSGWPNEQHAREQWLEFDILARERGADVDHPVRAELYDLGAYRLLVGTDVSDQRRIVRRLQDTALWGIALAAAAAGLVGWWYSRRVAARVRAAAQTCETIMSGDLAQRLAQSGSHDEFDQLAGAVNHMLDRVEHQTAAVRATFNSAAHDLRAPLHRIRVRLESIETHAALADDVGAALGDSVADLERVQRTLATLLQIARADAASAPGNDEPVDLAELAEEIGDLYAPEARERGLGWEVRASAPARVRGNRQLLAQLLVNLLENAIKYVPAGGHVLLAVAADGAQVHLRVEDDGPGIPVEARAQVLQPFHRLDRDETSSGSGLGLSLVAAVVRLHQGQLRLEDRGPGLRVSCEFPALNAPPPSARDSP